MPCVALRRPEALDCRVLVAAKDLGWTCPALSGTRTPPELFRVLFCPPGPDGLPLAAPARVAEVPQAVEVHDAVAAGGGADGRVRACRRTRACTYCIALHGIVLYCIVLQCIAVHCIVWRGMTWHDMALYGIVLHCIPYMHTCIHPSIHCACRTCAARSCRPTERPSPGGDPDRL